MVAFLIAAIGWLFRELHFRRERRDKATQDASETLKDRKALLEELIARIDEDSQKEEIQSKLDEVNTALLGLHAERLRRTLKAAGLPPEEALIADGHRQLRPQEAAHLKGIIEELEALPPFVSTRDLSVLGSAYYHTQQYEEAKNIYDKILKLNPDDPVTLSNRGATYRHLERHDEALADYNHSLELKPDDPVTLMNQGILFDTLERYDEALADYNHSLELRPDHPLTLSNRGVTYRNVERYDEALADFIRALELEPDHPNTLYNLACLCSLRGKTEDALDYLEKATIKDKKYREMAKTDKDFDNIRDDPRFKKLMESD